MMDVEMPGMDGFETCRRIRKIRGGDRVWVVAVTAHASMDIREQCFAAGMDDFLSKPIVARSLERVLENAAGQARLRRVA